MAYRIRVEGSEREVEILALRPQLRVSLAEDAYAVAAGGATGERFELTVDGIVYSGWRCRHGDAVYVWLRGRTYVIELLRREAHADGAAAQEEIRASMPGVVVTVHCQQGQRVMTGEPLITLESMKLQMTVVAAHAGTVRQVHVVPEAVFERGALLVSLAHEEAQEP
jgi:3-methylcrotonyl-CoA carboxylase alpha subunit